MTLLKSHLKVPIPHNKRKASATAHDKARERFFQQTYELITRTLTADDWAHIKCVIIGSPEDTNFYDYLFEEAQRRGDKLLLENKKKFVKVKVSSSHKQALRDVLRDPAVQILVKEVQATEEVAALNRFYEVLNSDPLRAVYGYREVLFALENGAVDTLLVTNSLFRSTDLNTRKKYVALVDKAKQSSGTKIRIFSSAHVSGERKKCLSRHIISLSSLLFLSLPFLFPSHHFILSFGANYSYFMCVYVDRRISQSLGCCCYFALPFTSDRRTLRGGS
jgi:protein pelota